MLTDVMKLKILGADLQLIIGGSCGNDCENSGEVHGQVPEQ